MKPPISSITSSVEPGEGGQHQPPGAPSHPSAPTGDRSPPMGDRSPVEATREGKSMCCHRGILKSNWVPQCLEHPQNNAAPQEQHPPAFSGSRAMPGMGVWLAGRLLGTGTSLGTLGTAGHSRDCQCGTTIGRTGRLGVPRGRLGCQVVCRGAYRRVGARGPVPAGSPPGPPSRPHAGASSGV